MDVTGRLSDAIHWDYYQPGTIVLTDNCTAAIRPAAKDALSGIFRSLADFGEAWESCFFYKVLQTSEGYRKSNSFMKFFRLRRSGEILFLFLDGEAEFVDHFAEFEVMAVAVGHET